MKLSVVIPCGRRPDAILPVLHSCAAQRLTNEGCEVLVVSNPPNPAVGEIVRSVPTRSSGPRFRVLEVEPAGANRARNRGLAEATGELIYFLDDDCSLPHEHHFAELMRAHFEWPEIDGLGGKYFSPVGASTLCRFYNAMTELWLESNRTESGEQLVLLGGNASYKRRVFEAGHTFDETLVYGGTETEFNHRLVRAGMRLRLEERLAVIHDFGGTWRSLLRRAWKQGGGKARNPHRGALVARRQRRPAIASLETSPRPRWLFAAFLATYYAAVQCGYLTGRIAGVLSAVGALSKERWRLRRRPPAHVDADASGSTERSTVTVGHRDAGAD